MNNDKINSQDEEFKPQLVVKLTQNDKHELIKLFLYPSQHLGLLSLTVYRFIRSIKYNF